MPQYIQFVLTLTTWKQVITHWTPSKPVQYNNNSIYDHRTTHTITWRVKHRGYNYLTGEAQRIQLLDGWSTEVTITWRVKHRGYNYLMGEAQRLQLLDGWSTEDTITWPVKHRGYNHLTGEAQRLQLLDGWSTDVTITWRVKHRGYNHLTGEAQRLQSLDGWSTEVKITTKSIISIKYSSFICFKFTRFSWGCPNSETIFSVKCV